jgi:hypothetical protein
VNHHIAPIAQRSHSLLLPQIRDCDLHQILVQSLSDRRHDGSIAEEVETGKRKPAIFLLFVMIFHNRPPLNLKQKQKTTVKTIRRLTL